MNRSVLLSIFVAFSAHASPAFTDFTGTWLGSCVGKPSTLGDRVVVTMTDDSEILIGDVAHELPDGHKDSISNVCETGDEMSPKPAHCSTVYLTNNFWNDTKTEISLRDDWQIWIGSKMFKAGSLEHHLRLIGNALQIAEQSQNGDLTSAAVCTYPHRR